MLTISNSSIIKKIVLAFMVTILISNFIMANYVYVLAEEEDHYDGTGGEYESSANDVMEKLQSVLDVEEEISEQDGGLLFTPITDFLVGVADNVLGTLQSIFLEDRKILSNLFSAQSIAFRSGSDTDFFSWVFGNDVDYVTLYLIKYSPAAVFSGNIPALDINFFSPQGEEGQVDVKKTKIVASEEDHISYSDCISSFGAPDSLNVHYDNMSLAQLGFYVLSLVFAINALEALANASIEVGLLSIRGEFWVRYICLNLRSSVTCSLELCGGYGSCS